MDVNLDPELIEYVDRCSAQLDRAESTENGIAELWKRMITAFNRLDPTDPWLHDCFFFIERTEDRVTPELRQQLADALFGFAERFCLVKEEAFLAIHTMNDWAALTPLSDWSKFEVFLTSEVTREAACRTIQLLGENPTGWTDSRVKNCLWSILEELTEERSSFPILGGRPKPLPPDFFLAEAFLAMHTICDDQEFQRLLELARKNPNFLWCVLWFHVNRNSDLPVGSRIQRIRDLPEIVSRRQRRKNV